MWWITEKSLKLNITKYAHTFYLFLKHIQYSVTSKYWAKINPRWWCNITSFKYDVSDKIFLTATYYLEWVSVKQVCTWFFHWLSFVNYTCSQSCPQSKNTVSTNIKHSRYIHLMSNFLSIRFPTKRLYVHMFDIVHTPLVMEENWLSANCFRNFPRQKKVLCVWS